MSRSNSSGYSFLIEVAIWLALVGTFVVSYAVCFLAVHLSVAAASASWGEATTRYRNPRAQAMAAGLVTALLWTLTGTILGAFGGSETTVLAGLSFGALVGAVAGWHVAGWQEAMCWAHLRNSQPLGMLRVGRFRVKRPYAVTPGERFKHIALMGPTGSGKTTLLKRMIDKDIRDGAGLCVIDPKDDLIDDVLAHMPPERENDVILFDATDTERPLAFNPLSGVRPERRSLAASELLAVFRRYFADSWGARLEHILRNVILALLEVPQATLVDVPRLLLDRAFAQWALGQVTNPAVRQFFAVEYEEVLRRRGDAVEPILNKVGPWLAYPELRNIIGQAASSFECRQVMDQGNILLARIPQGALGEDISSLLGSLLAAKIQLAAHSRVDVPQERRRAFFLYVDEFQNFATSSFSRILAEARAFRLGLVCANQYREQLPRELQLAIARNVATGALCAYRRGEYLIEVTRLEDGEEAPSFLLSAAPPLQGGSRERAGRIRASSRTRYGRVQVEPERLVTQLIAPAGNGRRHRVTIERRDIDED